MGKYYININNIILQKIIGLMKGRKKSELVETALLFYFKSKTKDELKEFINPIFEREFKEILKKVKEEKWKKFYKKLTKEVVK